MYRTSGYCEVVPFNDEPYADHWFEKPLSEHVVECHGLQVAAAMSWPSWS